MSTIMINGPEGHLEARYNQAEQEDAPVALFLHPHPMHGGTMNNKVIYNLYHTFQKRNFSVLRFNFRGVGLSQGSHSKGEGELSDAATALDWLQVKNPNAKHCWIIGFSFGAWVGMQLLMRRPDIGGFIAVAPPSNLYDFSFLSPCPASGLIIQGELDQIVPIQEQTMFAQRLMSQRRVEVAYEIINDADHFFSKHLAELQNISSEYLDRRLELIKQGKTPDLPFFGLDDICDDDEFEDEDFDDEDDIEENDDEHNDEDE